MDEYVDRRFARSTTRGELTGLMTPNWSVIALSAAGVIFILLGLLALAISGAQEGDLVWQLNSTHAMHWMDIAGLFTAAIGVALTWLSGQLWKSQISI